MKCPELEVILKSLHFFFLENFNDIPQIAESCKGFLLLKVAHFRSCHATGELFLEWLGSRSHINRRSLWMRKVFVVPWI